VVASARCAAKGCAEHSISRNWLSLLKSKPTLSSEAGSALDELDKDMRD
jgi:hypothetical protein